MITLTSRFDLHSNSLHILRPWDEKVVVDVNIVACCVVKLKVEPMENSSNCDENFCKCKAAGISQWCFAEGRHGYLLHSDASPGTLAERHHVLLQTQPFVNIEPPFRYKAV